MDKCPAASTDISDKLNAPFPGFFWGGVYRLIFQISLQGFYHVHSSCKKGGAEDLLELAEESNFVTSYSELNEQVTMTDQFLVWINSISQAPV